MEEYVKQISDIRKILNERTKFHALSGISGILAGIYAIIGGLIAYKIIYSSDEILYNKFKEGYYSEGILKLFILAATVLIMAILTGLYFSHKRAEGKLFTKATMVVIREFLVFMITGGIVLLACYLKGYYTMLSPVCLIIYGLALIHCASYINSEVKQLGYSILLVGLVTLFFPGYGLFSWMLGFGLLHIIYGFLMWYKYERE